MLEDPRHLVFSNPRPTSREILLALNVVVETLDEVEQNMRNSGQVRMIPASKKAVEDLLKKVKFEGDDATDNCSICFVGFNKDERVSALSFEHVYDQECISKWLEKNSM